MADDRELYPLTTPAGVAIPYDVFRPFGLIIADIDASVTPDIAIPVGAELLVCISTQPCVIRFGETNAEISSEGTHQADAFLLVADMYVVLDPNEATELTAIGLSATAGKLYINTAKKWKDLQIAARLDRT